MVDLAMGSLRFLKIFLIFDIPETTRSVSIVFADNQSENEIWNKLKQFLPVCYGFNFQLTILKQIKLLNIILFWLRARSLKRSEIKFGRFVIKWLINFHRKRYDVIHLCGLHYLQLKIMLSSFFKIPPSSSCQN